MLSKFSHLVAIATLTTLTCIITHPSSAKTPNNDQPVETKITETIPPFGVNRLVNQAFSANSGNFFEGATMAGQLNTIFGWERFPQGSFPENNITRDGLLLHAILYDYFRQLQEREPTIRTYDLPNPFDTSLKEDMDYRQ